MGFRVVVAGATGNVGRKLLDILAERRFPADEIKLLASPRSVGKEVAFGGSMLTCAGLEEHDFAGADIALFAAGSEVSRRHVPRAAGAGCVVIDQFLALPIRRGCAAGRFRGERVGPGRLPGAQYRRQSELLDHADGGGAEAAA